MKRLNPRNTSLSSIFLAGLTLGIPNIIRAARSPRPTLTEPPPKFDEERKAAALLRRQRRELTRTQNNERSRALNPCFKAKKVKAAQAAPATHNGL